ncbi:MAG: hypothetical protein H6707_17565 [Deltaproteobacteria bacterium]|nr:hypothetical protein [Deltaproteobacteria bacterium]
MRRSILILTALLLASPVQASGRFGKSRITGRSFKPQFRQRTSSNQIPQISQVAPPVAGPQGLAPAPAKQTAKRVRLTKEQMLSKLQTLEASGYKLSKPLQFDKGGTLNRIELKRVKLGSDGKSSTSFATISRSGLREEHRDYDAKNPVADSKLGLWQEKTNRYVSANGAERDSGTMRYHPVTKTAATYSHRGYALPATPTGATELQSEGTVYRVNENGTRGTLFREYRAYRTGETRFWEATNYAADGKTVITKTTSVTTLLPKRSYFFGLFQVTGGTKEVMTVRDKNDKVIKTLVYNHPWGKTALDRRSEILTQDKRIYGADGELQAIEKWNSRKGQYQASWLSTTLAKLKGALVK